MQIDAFQVKSVEKSVSLIIEYLSKAFRILIEI